MIWMDRERKKRRETRFKILLWRNTKLTFLPLHLCVLPLSSAQTPDLRLHAEMLLQLRLFGHCRSLSTSNHFLFILLTYTYSYY